MSTETLTTGQNTWVGWIGPDTPREGATRLAIAQADKYSAFVAFPLGVGTEQTAVQSLMTFWMIVTSGMANKAINVRAVDGSWDAEDLTFNNQPAVRAGVAVGNTGAASAVPKAITVDVTSLVQAIFDGLPNYGFRINVPDVPDTEATPQIESFASSRVDQPWTLQTTTLDGIEPPIAVYPAGEISGPHWVCHVPFVDLAGDADFGGIQVQVDPDATAPYAFDSGIITDIDAAELDLADTAHAALANGASTFWRGQTFTATGEASGWSAWVKVTRVDDPGFVIDRPADGVLASAKPRIAGHLTGNHPVTGQPFKIAAHQIWVFGPGGGERYDSGRRANKATDKTTFAWQVPFRAPGFIAYDEDGHVVGDSRKVVFPDDGDYKIRIRLFPTGRRQWGGPDAPPYLQRTLDVTFAPDGVLQPPDTMSAEPATDGPGAVLTWTLPLGAPVPDFFTISRNGIRTTNLEVSPIAGDGDTEALTYQYLDRGALPNTTNDYTIRSGRNDDEDGPVESGKSPHAYTENPVDDVWICSEHGNVMLLGNDVEQLGYREKRTTVELPFAAADADVVTARTGLEGSFTGHLDLVEDLTPDDIEAAREILRAIRADITTPVYFVYGLTAAEVVLKNLSVRTSPDHITDFNRRLIVSFDVMQVGEFDQAG